MVSVGVCVVLIVIYGCGWRSWDRKAVESSGNVSQFLVMIDPLIGLRASVVIESPCMQLPRHDDPITTLLCCAAGGSPYQGGQCTGGRRGGRIQPSRTGGD
jgi:hypothetical protein